MRLKHGPQTIPKIEVVIVPSMRYYVYLLECADKSIYTGITTDVKRRFAEHKQGTGASYTRSHPVRKILRVEEYATRSEALKREAEIKRWPRSKKLELVKAASVSFPRRRESRLIQDLDPGSSPG